MGVHDTLGIVVVNFGSTRLLRENLAVLTKDLPEALVVVVDNPTTSEERSTAERLCAEHGWHLVPMATNVGFGGGMNAGVALARDLGAEWFLLLNPDVVITADGVRVLHERARRGGAALVAPRLVRPDGTTWSVGSHLLLDDGAMRSAAAGEPVERSEFWLSGACLLLGSELWERCGGFADDYFLYWEDVELSRRARLVGADLVLVDDVVAEHAAGGTQGAGQSRAGTPKSEIYYYYNTRNRLLFAARNLDEQDVRGWMRTAVPAGRAIVLRGGRRQLLRSWRPIVAVWRGTRDGRRLARAALHERESGAPPSRGQVASR